MDDEDRYVDVVVERATRLSRIKNQSSMEGAFGARRALQCLKSASGAVAVTGHGDIGHVEFALPTG